MNKELIKKILTEISRVLLGVTFIFSGFVKAVDPHGFGYKIDDYLSAFHIESLQFLSLPASIILCVLEFTLGVFLLLGLYRKWASRLILLVMLFMTPLTLYLALTNPVTDCGCFGDALIITNWETFGKNVVLLLCAVCVFLYHNKIQNLFSGKTYWLAAFFTVVFITSFSIYNIIYEPVFDFRPYKVGANILDLTTVEEGKGDVFENILVYEKDGKRQEYTEDNYPWQDTTWKFVERKPPILVKEGLKPAITDFSIEHLRKNPTGTEFTLREDITNEVLENDGYTFLMIAYSLDKMDDSHLSKFEDINNYAEEHDYQFYCLTASGTDEILAWEKANAIDFEFCITDGRALKTITRSNPGLILLKNGSIVKKWANIEVPDESQLTQPADKLFNIELPDNSSILTKIGLLFIVPLVLLKAFDLLFMRKKKKEEETTTDKSTN